MSSHERIDPVIVDRYLVERMNAPINGQDGPASAAAAAAAAAPLAVLATPMATPSRSGSHPAVGSPFDASPRWKHDVEEQLVTVSGRASPRVAAFVSASLPLRHVRVPLFTPHSLFPSCFSP
jgi:hypothetical protein